MPIHGELKDLSSGFNFFNKKKFNLKYLFSFDRIVNF